MSKKDYAGEAVLGAIGAGDMVAGRALTRKFKGVHTVSSIRGGFTAAGEWVPKRGFSLDGKVMRGAGRATTALGAAAAGAAGVSAYNKRKSGKVTKSAFGVDHEVGKGFGTDFKTAGAAAGMAKPGGLKAMGSTGSAAFGGTKSGAKLKSIGNKMASKPLLTGGAALGTAGAGGYSMGNKKNY